jgi:sugar/nucleoside kinase (ribokinase family)
MEQNGMLEILTAGEILVEFMREKSDVSLIEQNTFIGPFVSGAPAIFADTAAKMGHSSAIIGGVGKDDFGTLCLNRLKNDNVDISGIKVSPKTTGCAFVAYKKDGSRNFIFHLRDSAAADFGNLPIDVISKAKIFHIMGCSLMISEDLDNKIFKIAETVKSAGGKISFDPNVRPELIDKSYFHKSIKRILRITDILLTGKDELLFITNTDNVELISQKLLDQIEIIALKMGKEGCKIYSKYSNEELYMPVYRINEIDPTGAGDSFDAGFLSGILEDKSLPECAKLANACGAMNASKFGPMEGVYNREIIEKFINDNN